MPGAAERESRARAESLYAHEVARLGPDEGVDLERLCASHPGLVAELALVHADWQRARGVYRALGQGRGVAERLRERFGAELDPAIVIEPKPQPVADTLARSVIERLGLRLPRQSRYEVLEEVARGGMGAILKVWDPDLRRTLAMKVALTSGAPRRETHSLDSSAELPLARFLEEAQVTGQLDHPGIVPVHELGLDDEGRVFFTMRLVRGENLEAIFAHVHAGEAEWTRARAVRALHRICETMAYAHDKGVIHRDLKPANVMVGRYGEVYVMDWGLARVMGRTDKKDLRVRRRDATSLNLIRTDRGDVRETGGGGSLLETMDGDVVGTPAYMSPQQALGEVEALDERTDVYALGAMLYHLLAGHMPYVPPGKKPSPYAVWGMVKDGPPEPLAERAPAAPPELVAICEKAMQRDLSARYPSAQALADDLSAYLDGRVVRAYERGALAELRKWIGRNRGVAGAIAAAAVVALGGLGGVSWVQARANKRLAESNEALARANEAEVKASAEAGAARLVAERTAEEVTRQRDGAERVVAFLVGLFESPDPARTRGALVTAKDLLDRGARSIASELGTDPLVRARLSETMGRAYHELGLFEQARALLQGAFDEHLRRQGPDDPETLRVEGALARTVGSLGEWAEAQRLFDETLAGERRALGDDDRETLDTQNELARLYRVQARFGESRALHEAVLADRRRVLGENDPDTLQTTRDLARVCRDQDDLPEALRLLGRALPGYRVALGDDHPATLRALNELGVVEQQAGRLDEADEHLRAAYEGRRRVLGEDHPETLWSLADRAYLGVRRGDYRQAETLYKDALERHRRVLGEDHPDTLALLIGLGGLYQLQNRLNEAETLLTEAVERAQAALGPDHLRTLGCRFGLAAVFAKQARFDEAQPMVEDALAGFERALGPTHPQTLTIQEDLVRLLRDRGRLDDALALGRELVERTPVADPSRPRRAALVDEIEARRRTRR